MGKKWHKEQQKTAEAVEYAPNPEINRVFEPKSVVVEEPATVPVVPFTAQPAEALRGYPASIRMPDGSIELNPRR